MNNYTMDLYQMKREIVNFSKKMSDGCKKVDEDMIMDILYGMQASKSVLISKISRELKEDIKLKNTIERLCIRLEKFDNSDIVLNNYYNYVRKYLPIKDDERIVHFDDSDIVKVYGKKFEDLDLVRDASDPDGKIKPGYHVCNVTGVGKNEKQPFWIYSKIYSTKSDGFKSQNDETMKSIEAAIKLYEGRFTGVFDRGYDDKKLFRFLLDKKIHFVIRSKGNRSLLFNGQKRNIMDVAKSKKGKINMNVMREDGINQEVKISYTKANLLDGKKEELTIVFVYGFKDNEPMILITDKEIKNKKDAIKIVRMYIDRWKIEEVHRAVKEEYDYENMRVRSLKSMNNLNLIVMIMLGFHAKKIEEMNNNLMSIKILEASKSLKKKCVVWLSQFARGIGEILRYSHVGVKSFQYKNKSNKIVNIQLSLEL